MSILVDLFIPETIYGASFLFNVHHIVFRANKDYHKRIGGRKKTEDVAASSSV